MDLRRYHAETRHSRRSVLSSTHGLDWAIKPLPFKIYTTLEGTRPPEDVGRLCLYSNGVLRWGAYRGEPYGFRAAACTGALYHVELYLAWAGRDDLPAGLYHYGAHDHELRLLRPGDVRGALVEAAGAFEPLASAEGIFVVTSTFWRNAWKYQSRAYRHAFWDGGTVLANLLALASQEGLAASVAMGFADGAVNRLVGADGEREVAIALVAVGAGANAPPATEDLPELDLPTVPLSRREIRYPEIEAAHQASSLGSGAEAAAWRARARHAPIFAEATLPDAPVADVIRRRRSARRFANRPMTREQLDGALAAALAPVPGDAFEPRLVEPSLIVNAVEGVEPGVYGPGLTPIRTGDFRQAGGELALWQSLGAEAAADVYFLSDLDRVMAPLGERGYRVAQMAGGIAGGRLELAAAAAGLGATGLTFFDDDVIRFFEPASAGRQVMYLAALGHRKSSR